MDPQWWAEVGQWQQEQEARDAKINDDEVTHEIREGSAQEGEAAPCADRA